MIKPPKRTKKDILKEVAFCSIKLSEVIDQHNNLLNIILNFQKDYLAMKEVLKQKGVVTEFEVEKMKTSLDELRQMEEKALIIKPQ